MEPDPKLWCQMEQGGLEKVPRLLLRKRYTKLETAVVDLESATSLQKRRWRLRLRPKVRVLISTISSIVHRIRKAYVRVMLNLAAKARDSKLLPGLTQKKRRSAGAIGTSTTKARVFRKNDLEQKYLDYIKKSVTDGELAYYTMSLRNVNIL